MSVQVNMYYELLFMSESLLKSLNISYKARNTDLALPTFKLNPMWCACFTAISYWANSIQIWFITLHIYRFERSISVYWNEMKWRIYYKIYTEKEREREREREKYLQKGLWLQFGRLRCQTILGRRTRDSNHKQILKKTVASLSYSSSELPILHGKMK